MRLLGPSALNQTQRQSHLDQMASGEFDIVVVGGGVTGCGVALDAASRGLRVALVEQRDYGSGTSSRSSKLIHGGLRYLEQRNFRLVREALAERNLMLNVLCPHLVEPVPFLYPLHRRWERAYVGAGVFLYDLLADKADNPLPRHKHLSKKGTKAIAPGLEVAGLTGGIQYWDARVDDARHTMTLARTAAASGALLASSTRVVGFETQADRISAVEVMDLEGGKTFSIATRVVISAGGVWTDDIQALGGETGLDVRSSKGIHLLVPRDAIDSSVGLILRTEESVLFVIPWAGHWIVGTTDTPWSLQRAHPAASKADIDYLLGWANTVLARRLTTDDIVGVYAGLRPLLKGESEATSKLSREHAVLETPNGLVSVAGGKYTTYRVMARDAVDLAASRLPGPAPPSLTHTIRLVGEERERELEALARDNPEMDHPLGDSRFRLTEVSYAVTHEGALHLDDVLTRRTRVSIETRHRGTEVAGTTARLMGAELGWDEKTISAEVGHYLARVAAERDSQTRIDDDTADAARMGAGDVRGLNPD